MSSPTLAYPSSGDLNVLVQRFKLLNIVQRVAHRDVSEMLDTIGLEGLSRNTTLSRWACYGPAGDDVDDCMETGFPRRGGAPRYPRAESVPRASKRRLSPITRNAALATRLRCGQPTARLEARVAAAQVNREREEVVSRADSRRRLYTSTHHKFSGESSRRAPATTATTSPRQYGIPRTRHGVHRSPSERESFFSRLAEPRQRPVASVAEAFLCDDEIVQAAHSRRGDAVNSPRPSRQELDRSGGRGVDPYPAHGAPTFVSSAHATSQRHHTPLDAYSTQKKDLRAHSSAPPQFSISSLHGAPSGSREVFAGAENIAELGDNKRRPHHSTSSPHSEREVFRDVDFTPSQSQHHQLLRISPPSLEVSQRMRSVNFAPIHDKTRPGALQLAEGPRTETRGAAEGLELVLQPDGDSTAAFSATTSAEMLSKCGGGAGASANTFSVSQLHLSASGNSGGDTGEPVYVGERGGSSTEYLGRRDSASQKATGNNSLSASNSQFPKSPRLGRGLVPKAKPKGAMDSAPVPLEAVRQAAAIVSRTGLTLPNHTSVRLLDRPEAVVQSPPRRASSACVWSSSSAYGDEGRKPSPRPHTVSVGRGAVDAVRDSARKRPPEDGAHVSASSGDTAQMGPLQLSDGVAFTASRTDNLVNTTTKKSFEELSSAIDHMLLDHQQLLRQVYKGIEAPARGMEREPAAFAAGSSSSKRSCGAFNLNAGNAYATALEGDVAKLHVDASCGTPYANDADATIEVDLGSDGDGDSPVEAMSSEVEDEMLLYTKLQSQLARLDADMARLGLESAEGQVKEVGDGSAIDGAVGASGFGEEAPVRQREALKADVAHQPARHERSRGEVPDAIVQRLCAYRMNHFQYIAYNERLWNTSSVSQFVFAQRLTAALIEECWGEVMTEVGAIMDEYVDGLAEHELQ